MYLTANSQEITLRLQGVLNIDLFPDATPRVRGNDLEKIWSLHGGQAPPRVCGETQNRYILTMHPRVCGEPNQCELPCGSSPALAGRYWILRIPAKSVDKPYAGL